MGSGNRRPGIMGAIPSPVSNRRPRPPMRYVGEGDNPRFNIPAPQTPPPQSRDLANVAPEDMSLSDLIMAYLGSDQADVYREDYDIDGDGEISLRDSIYQLQIQEGKRNPDGTPAQTQTPPPGMPPRPGPIRDPQQPPPRTPPMEDLVNDAVNNMPGKGRFPGKFGPRFPGTGPIRQPEPVGPLPGMPPPYTPPPPGPGMSPPFVPDPFTPPGGGFPTGPRTPKPVIPGNEPFPIEPPMPPGKLPDWITSCPSPEEHIQLANNDWILAGDLKVGDEVVTSEEPQKVTFAKTIEDSPRREVLFTEGDSIVTSPSHPYFVNSKGFVDVEDLKEGDEVGDLIVSEVKPFSDGPVIHISVDKTETYMLRGGTEENPVPALSHNKSPMPPTPEEMERMRLEWEEKTQRWATNPPQVGDPEFEAYTRWWERENPPWDPTSCPSPEEHIQLANNDWILAGEIKVGDEVITSEDPQKVTRVQRIENSPRCEVLFEDSNSIVTSYSHPYFVNSKGFVEVGDLKKGDIIGDLVVKDKKPFSDGPVISLSVDKAHTYMLQGGTEENPVPALSHNKWIEQPPDWPTTPPGPPQPPTPTTPTPEDPMGMAKLLWKTNYSDAMDFNTFWQAYQKNPDLFQIDGTGPTIPTTGPGTPTGPDPEVPGAPPSMPQNPTVGQEWTLPPEFGGQTLVWNGSTYVPKEVYDMGVGTGTNPPTMPPPPDTTTPPPGTGTPPPDTTTPPPGTGTPPPDTTTPPPDTGTGTGTTGVQGMTMEEMQAMIDKLNAEKAANEAAQAAAAQKYTIDPARVGNNPYLTGQYQADPYGASGVPNMGGLTTIPVPQSLTGIGYANYNPRRQT